MRFRSDVTDGYRIFAVSGVNTISFAVDFEGADTSGLLGFAVERHDIGNDERYFMRGFKVFKEVIPFPDESTEVSTYEHPVQSFVWDDFTAKPGNSYEYYFHPIKGRPKNLDRTANPIRIAVKTEPLLHESGGHNVFFNRGVASSQAYARRFNNSAPEEIKDLKEKGKALAWLSRDLLDGIAKFIRQAKSGDTLLGCFYEFHYRPVLDEFRAALERGVDVRLIIDAKVNEYTDGKGKFHESFPRNENLKAVKAAGIPASCIIRREANQSYIQHNKFIVLLKGAKQKPVSVWTGSTNISIGGFCGQTNVGHWIPDGDAAERYRAYWEMMSGDPGGVPGGDRSDNTKKNNEFKNEVVALTPDIARDEIAGIPAGVTPIFSPRRKMTMLDTYSKLLDSAENYSGITLAFGINDVIKEYLKDNKPQDHITFMLLEKKDQKNLKSDKPFINLNAKNNVYKAWGSYIKDPLYQWTKEVNTKLMKVNSHVLYIHSKFLMVDPLGGDPIVVSGSANFSEDSTMSNDENMVIIRGDMRVADIYFTEFNRLFNHYYFRAVYEDLHKKSSDKSAPGASLFLSSDDNWLKKYQAGMLKYKRVDVFRKMEGFE